MAHHRCTRCKQEAYPRHKYYGGVFGDTCIREIRGFRPQAHGRGWFSSIWERIRDFATSVFSGKTIKRVTLDKERASYSQFKAYQARARDIPSDPQGGTPGKH